MPQKIRKPFLTWKKTGLVILVLLFAIGISGYLKVTSVKNHVKELFKLNKELQEQNYYMAEFEFKMLGIAYYLDKGNYSKAMVLIDKLDMHLKTKKGLIKMPDFKSKEQELAFYLDLQNPKTGAFMDAAYPLSSYHGPTENVLAHIEVLSKALGKPVRLKYPLNYLDEINTPEKLTHFLDDVSTVGWIAAKLPQTSFHNARDILSLARDNINYSEDKVDIFSRNNLYNFSPKWKRTMLEWFYKHQDPKTGLWGPRSKKGKLLKKDLMNTASIMKAFVDRNGNNIHADFPLRYKKELFASALVTLSEPVPADDDMGEIHEWNLKTPKTIRLLTRYLWKDASQINKDRARVFIEKYIRIKCDKYYIPKEGAFSYYPGGKHATIDGAGAFFIFKDIGALSAEKQKTLWGTPAENIVETNVTEVFELTQNNFQVAMNTQNVNSLRFYKVKPDEKDLGSNVFAIVYPKKTIVPDILDLTPKMKKWLYNTPLTMGNWTSKTSLQNRLAQIKSDKINTYIADIPVEKVNSILHKNQQLVVIGFDVLQIPRVKFVFNYNINGV